jgi:transposase
MLSTTCSPAITVTSWPTHTLSTTTCTKMVRSSKSTAGHIADATSLKLSLPIGASKGRALFRIERTLAGSPRKKREKIREKRSRPIIDRFFSWCDAEAAIVLDDTPISGGIRYSRNQRVGLTRFLEDGRLPIHNNWSELELRRQAVGRKNWLFVGHDDAGAVNATFTSLLASCRLCDVEPWTYLRDILCLLPSWPEHRLLELAPVEWKDTRDRDDVRALLEQNRLRRLTFAPESKAIR